MKQIDKQTIKNIGKKTLPKYLQKELNKIDVKVTDKTTYRNVYNRLAREARIETVREAWTDFEQGIISLGEMRQVLKKKPLTFQQLYKKATTFNTAKKITSKQVFKKLLHERLPKLARQATMDYKKNIFIDNWRKTALKYFPREKTLIEKVVLNFKLLNTSELSALIRSGYAEIKVLYAKEGDIEGFRMLCNNIIKGVFENDILYQQTLEQVLFAKSELKNIKDIENLSKYLLK